MVHDARVDDVEAMAGLAAAQRAEYAAAQPQFWRRAAGDTARHLPWVARQVQDPAVVSLVVRTPGGLEGFLLASVVPPPPVYDPGGPTGLVDDFAVATASLWPTVGRQLVEAARVRLADLGAVQLVVVCGHHDEPKRSLLQQCGLAVASEWLVAPLR